MCETCVQAATEITKAIAGKLVVTTLPIDGSASDVEPRATRLGKHLGIIYKQIYAAVSEASKCED